MRRSPVIRAAGFWPDVLNLVALSRLYARWPAPKTADRHIRIPFTRGSDIHHSFLRVGDTYLGVGR